MIEMLDSTLKQVTDLLGKLYGLPGYVSVFLFCLAFGYALKRSKWCPNDAIPALVIGWGSIWTTLIADPRADTLPLRVWVVKNVVFGALVGCAAWIAHANRRRIPLIKRFIVDEKKSASQDDSSK